jgi:hypothetical protein
MTMTDENAEQVGEIMAGAGAEIQCCGNWIPWPVRGQKAMCPSCESTFVLKDNGTPEREPEYSAVIEAVKDAYQERVLALLGRIAEACRGEDLIVEGPHDLSDDNFRWTLFVYRTPLKRDDEDLVDVTLEIVEGADYDGREAAFGINFGIDVVEYGGRQLGGLQPYNFTPDVWVDARDADAVAARWQLIEDAEISEIPDLITADREWNEDGWYKDLSEPTAAELAAKEKGTR